MCAYYYHPHPQVFALHPIDQPPHHPQWPPQQVQQAISGQHMPNSTAPPLAYYYSSPRNSDDSSMEDGPSRGRPSYLNKKSSSSNYRDSLNHRQTTDILFLLIFLLFFGFLVSIYFDCFY